MIRIHGGVVNYIVLCPSKQMSCLFESIGQKLDIDPVSVRADICNYLHENQDECIHDLQLKHWIEQSEETTMAKYMRSMRKQETWGGYVELVAAAALYNCEIIVQYKRSHISIGDKGSGNTIKIHYNGCHFW